MYSHQPNMSLGFLPGQYHVMMFHSDFHLYSAARGRSLRECQLFVLLHVHVGYVYKTVNGLLVGVAVCVRIRMRSGPPISSRAQTTDFHYRHARGRTHNGNKAVHLVRRCQSGVPLPRSVNSTP